MGLQLDLLILEVFSSLNGSMILHTSKAQANGGCLVLRGELETGTELNPGFSKPELLLFFLLW